MIRSETIKTAALVLAAGALALGCPTADGGGDDGAFGDTGETGKPQPQVTSKKIKCCYTLGRFTPGTAPVYEQACTLDNSSPCVDPTDLAIDTNGDGELDVKEIVTNVCSKKCPSLPNGVPFYGGPFHKPGNEFLGVESGPWDGCTPTSGSIIESTATCDPTLPGWLDPWSLAPPSHEGTFTSGTPSNQANVTVNGIAIAVDYDGTSVFSLSNCSGSGDHKSSEICDLQLIELDLELVGNPTFGEYEVDGASLSLPIPKSTTVSFACDSRGCWGSFDFDAADGNALEMTLSWDQTRTSTQTVGGGTLLLSNGPSGLGGLNTVHGELDMDVTKSVGTLRLYGDGSDAFGGDLASATFDLTGPVGRYEP